MVEAAEVSGAVEEAEVITEAEVAAVEADVVTEEWEGEADEWVGEALAFFISSVTRR